MGNLIFIPQSIADYTITSVSSQESAHIKETMQDFRLDTYWRSTSNAAQNINIDLGTEIEIDHVLLRHNLPDGTYVDVYYATQADYSDEVSVTDDTPEVIGGGNKPGLYMPFPGGLPIKQRYWRIKITQIPANQRAEVHLLYMGMRQEITIRYKKGPLAERQYPGGSLQESFAGYRSAVNQAPAGRKVFAIGWEYLDATNRNRLQALIDITKGFIFPFFMRWPEGASYVYYFVRLMSPAIDAREVEDLLFNTDVLRFEEEL